MQVNFKKSIMLISLLPLFLPANLLIVGISISIFCLIYYFIEEEITLKKLYSLLLYSLIGIAFYFKELLIGLNNLSTLKIIYLFTCIIITSSNKNILFTNKKFVEKVLILYVYVNLTIILLQIFFPYLTIWSFISESDLHYDALTNGRIFGLSGNPTHSGYITLIITLSLIFIRSKLFYVLLSTLSLILILNKMTILIFLLASIFIYLKRAKKVSYKVLAFSATTAFSLFIFINVIFPYIERWSEVGYNTHTINYRIQIYHLILQEISKNYLLFGNPILYSEMASEAFDSLPALFLVKYGIILTIYIYIYIYMQGKKDSSIILYLSIILPSITMVAFYNTSYIFSIFFLYFLIQNNFNSKERK